MQIRAARNGSRRAPALIAVVGHSDSGKTSLLERLVPALTRRGLRVGCAKHASHGFDADQPGKDSYRLFQSGAQAVALVGGRQVATFVRQDEECDDENSLLKALETLPKNLDLVLVEGFSWEPIPRIVLSSGKDGAISKHSGTGKVLRYLRTDRRSPSTGPLFSPELIESLADQLVSWAHARPADTPNPSLPRVPRPRDFRSGGRHDGRRRSALS